MKKKLICAALLAGLGVAQAASAQEFDDSWYLTTAAGINVQDSDRTTEDAPFLAVGIGKLISPNWSLDGELNYQNPDFDTNPNLGWSQYGVSLDLRRHFFSDARAWSPYALFGLGYQKAEEQYATGTREDGNLAAKVGAGIYTKLANTVGIRAEAAYRVDFDDQALAPAAAGKDSDSFSDLLVSIGLVIPLERKPAPVPVAPPPAPAPVAPPPPPPAPEPEKLSIELSGVNFDFSKATLRPESIEILDVAVEVLNRFPELKVEVAGHTDLCGPVDFNQKLSQSRAKTVYDYLTNKGIAASRLTGPIGYGETRPLVQTPQTAPACRSETNRRTELNVL